MRPHYCKRDLQSIIAQPAISLSWPGVNAAARVVAVTQKMRCLQIEVPDSVTDESASQFLVNPGEQLRRHACACVSDTGPDLSTQLAFMVPETTGAL